MTNGLVKVAMYEHMASLFGGLPNAQHFSLYNLWSQGGWGMIMTGNVQVSGDHLSLGKDMIIPETITSGTLRYYRVLACAMRPAVDKYAAKNEDGSPSPRTLVIMQLSHAGRQSPIVLGGRPLSVPALAPSALGLGRSLPGGWFARLTYKIGFPTPRAMDLHDIDHVVHRFVLSAKLANEAGFDGIELHASHGCKSVILGILTCGQNVTVFVDLLAQFISPKVMVSWHANIVSIYLYFRATYETMPTALTMLRCIYFNGS